MSDKIAEADRVRRWWREANAEIASLRTRVARAEKVIQAARQLVEETRYLTVEQCERDGLSAGTGNRLRDALAEYGEKDDKSRV